MEEIELVETIDRFDQNSALQRVAPERNAYFAPGIRSLPSNLVRHCFCTSSGMLPQAPNLDPLTDRIIGAAIKVHSSLGPGLLEPAYQVCLEHELARRQIAFDRQVPVPVVYDDVHLDCGYRLVSLRRPSPIHIAQMVTYLKLMKRPVGLILNFNTTSLRQGIRRVANREFGGEADQLHARRKKTW